MKKAAVTKRVLIVDDEKDLLVLLKKVVSGKCGCDVELAESGNEAIAIIDRWHPDVVLTDIKMPDLDGLELLNKISELDATISTIIMTGYGTIEMAVQTLKDGAYDFFEKPFDNNEIIRAVSRALERTLLLRENLQLQQRLTQEDSVSGFIGQSPRLKQTLDLLSRLSQTDATVLIRGESGTGKEVAAKAIHAMSNRSKEKMVTVNCPALPEHILESELFGYAKGAFTGADTDKEGLFLKAHHSTLLLDEIGDIPITIQTKLLRVLQEKEIQPLGQTKSFKVDVRVLASTNQDLEKKMAEGEFREDLFFRLNVMSVTMPSLADISDDIPALAQNFLEMFAKKYNRKELEFTPEALHCLMNHSWKGNVRELQNTINRAVLLSNGSRITPADFMNPDQTDGTRGVSTGGYCVHQLPYKKAKEELLTRFAVSYLTNALIKSGGNVSVAARQSQMERQAFQRLMRRYSIVSTDFR